MKHAILAFLFPLFALVFGAPAQAQDCSLEAVATLTTELWGSEIAYTISDDNGILLSGENFSGLQHIDFGVLLGRCVRLLGARNDRQLW